MVGDRPEDLTARIQIDLDLLAEVIPTDPVSNMLVTLKRMMDDLEKASGLTPLQTHAYRQVQAALQGLGGLTAARDAWKGVDRTGGRSRTTRSAESV